MRLVYHHREDRIRAHVQLCWLALLLIRVAENRIGDTAYTWSPWPPPTAASRNASPSVAQRVVFTESVARGLAVCEADPRGVADDEICQLTKELEEFSVS